MGSYKYGYMSPNVGSSYSYLIYIAPHRTTHEPPSKARKHQPKGPEEAEDPEDSVDVALAVASVFRTVGLREVEVLGLGLYSCVFLGFMIAGLGFRDLWVVFMA